MVDQGARLNLYEAAAVGDVHAVKENLEKDFELLDVHSEDGWTALHLASFFGHQKVARLLLDQGAEVNVLSKNAMKNLPLHAALAGQRTEIAKMLIDANSDISVQDSAGWSPLHHAAAHGADEIVDILLERGANPKLKNNSGETPLILAEKKGHKSLAKRLLDVLLIS
ncbi:ankyrin repeat domain-containing protein [Melghirimyces profundicolus]|uniref:ankyrin repeat domain-containing protein n=1 Tax=Melghirimyces profundicolus TaxID=1242148 RepID=UPI00147471DB|nr:ankyrin repeat domain-containing protein [Melghirimyces profundicolus]